MTQPPYPVGPVTLELAAALVIEASGADTAAIEDLESIVTSAPG